MADAPAGETPTLALQDVSKAFGPVIELRSGSLTLYPGSIHALVGENGAGKSTLVKIIAGLYQRDSGTFLMEAQPVDFKTTAEARAAGIAVIYQEPTLFPDLSVTENVFMGRQQPTGRFGRIDRKAMRDEVRALMERLGVRIDPDRPTEGLSIADQQIIEIAKAISLDAKVLVMDEPTAALSGVEVERLFTVARSLRDEGRALMFISHRFDEVFDLCDTITVMRDGAYISTDAAADTDVPQIVRRMVGRDVSDLFPKQEAKIGGPLLEVENLNMPGVFHDISFTVRSGEIVGLAGLVGAGRSEVARAVFGVDPYESGRVSLGGKQLQPRNPSAAMELGLALVPEDRRKQGLVIDATVSQNITAAIRDSLSKLGLITSKAENASARVWASRLEVKTRALDAVAGTLSGGNQQKVVLAKWLATTPRVLIIDEPTRGIDVGTKSEVHRMMSELAGEGLGTANDKKAIGDALNEARDAGIKVVTFDSDTDPEYRDLFVNQATAEDIAKVQIDMIAEQIGDAGEIAILSASANATNQNAWIELMKKELENHPNIKLVDTVYGNDKDQESFDKTAALLQSHPNLKGIIAPTTVGIAAAARYLSTSKAKGKVALTGLGTPNQMRKYVQDGTVKEFALWNPADLGYLAAYATKALITGEIKGNEGDKFKAGKLGDYTVEANNTVVLGDPYKFNKDNIDQFKF